MKLTISIINFNYARYLEKAVDSALLQSATGIDVEVLIIDDGSTDSSDSILDGYINHPRVKVSKSKNLGFGASIGRAINEAEGQWVMLLDADDWFAPNKLASIAPDLIGHHHCVLNLNVFVDEAGQPSGHQGSPGNTSTVTVRRAVAKEILPVEDESGFLLLQIAGHCRTVDRPLTFHRIHALSLASDPVTALERRSKRYRMMVDKIKGWAPGNPDWITESQCVTAIREFETMVAFTTVEAKIRRRMRFAALRAAFRLFGTCGNRRIAWRTIIRALLLRPIPSREKIFLNQ